MRRSCPITVRRAELVAVAEVEGASVPCVLCGLPMAKRKLSNHMATECSERLVSCKCYDTKWLLSYCCVVCRRHNNLLEITNQGRNDCGLRIVAHRLERHEAEWCDAPRVVALRGLSRRSRRLRWYTRTWTLNMASKPLDEFEDGDDDDDDDDDDDEDDEEDNASARKEGHILHDKELLGGDVDDDGMMIVGEELIPRPYVSVRKDPTTLARIRASQGNRSPR